MILSIKGSDKSFWKTESGIQALERELGKHPMKRWSRQYTYVNPLAIMSGNLLITVPPSPLICSM